MWPFWLLEPARAFALHHGLIIVSFLLGWKHLFKRLITDLNVDKAHVSWYAAAASVLLFCTGFSQFWWTTLGPLLAISPWLLLLIVRWQHSILHYVLLFYVACVWLLSHTYPPIIISMAYFGVMLLFVHQWRWWQEPKWQIVCSVLACLTGVAVVIFYFHDVISVMVNTIYPGQRVSQGGQTSGLLWLSSLLPFIAHSRYNDLLNLNICEVATAGSLLPIIVASLVKPNPSAVGRRAMIGATVLAIFCTLWMITPVPPVIAKLLLLDKVPSNRLVFLLGLILNYVALVVLIEGQVLFTRTRIVALVTLVAISMFLSSALGLVDWFDKNTPELALIIMAGIGFVLYQRGSQLSKYKKGLIVAMALIPNIYAYGGFNPIQSAFPIFDLHTRDAVKKLEQDANKAPPHWVVETGYPGATLSGLGLNSFTSVLVQPQLELFRTLFPDMGEYAFNQVFNRYAHVILSKNVTAPTVPQDDVILIPYASVNESDGLLSYKQYQTLPHNVPVGGYVDRVLIENNTITFFGWGWINKGQLYGPFSNTEIRVVRKTKRKDVLRAFNEPSLIESGFLLVINKSTQIDALIDKKGLCLFSDDPQFGAKKLNTNNLPERFKCKQ
ncbi:DUF7657 domain-containing protein [Salinivibrio socompensis]|uniref:DUF7657 domain-containing protein n=1 Tax=Salinivibrio socompensis TaxID=1510206 RepID=UPI0004AD8608|nr:hypothetical protein [Salinivibrio socompensis]